MEDGWETNIKRLNIDIYVPNNNSEIRIWGHGPYNGKSSIINNNHVNLYCTDIKPYQYVAGRILFDNSNIAKSSKKSKIDAMPIILSDEKDIIEFKTEKQAYNKKVIGMSICLFVYWIILLFVFEKDKKYNVINIEEDEIFKKYNPLIAGCIQGNRNILARDIISIVINLINKKVINLDLQNKLSDKIEYDYIIEKNSENEKNMDGIERFIYNWIFKNNDKVNLVDRLKKMPKEKDANRKFKELNDIASKKLSIEGANQAKVPMCIRVFNIFLFILSVIVVIKHILFNSNYNEYIIRSELNISFYICIFIFLLPLFLALLKIPINLIIIIRHKINKTVQRITGKKIVTTVISLIILFGTIIIFTAIISSSKYLVIDEILICIASIIVLTDNLMLKNSPNMIEDYSKLNALKNKISEYTLLDNKNFEDVILWEKYLSYAISFGIGKEMIKKIEGLNIDDDLNQLLNNINFVQYIYSDYSDFYYYASLDRRFVQEYNRTTNNIFKSIGSSYGSDSHYSGGGGDFSGGGSSFSGGGGRGRRRRSFLKKQS